MSKSRLHRREDWMPESWNDDRVFGHNLKQALSRVKVRLDVRDDRIAPQQEPKIADLIEKLYQLGVPIGGTDDTLRLAERMNRVCFTPEIGGGTHALFQSAALVKATLAEANQIRRRGEETPDEIIDKFRRNNRKLREFLNMIK